MARTRVKAGPCAVKVKLTRSALRLLKRSAPHRLNLRTTANVTADGRTSSRSAIATFEIRT